MDIRVATTEYLRKLNDLMFISKQHWGYDAHFMKKFISQFGLTESYLAQGMTFIAFEHNTLIGFYSFCYHPNAQFELDNFFPHPDFIGRGKGRELWDACVQQATEYGVQQFILWTDPNAEPFYLKMGCVKVGERPSPLQPGRCPPILEYRIDS